MLSDNALLDWNPVLDDNSKTGFISILIFDRLRQSVKIYTHVKYDVTHGDYYVPWDEIYLEDLLRGQPEELIGWQKMPAVPTKEAIIEFLKKAGRSFERPSDYKKRLPPWEL